MRYVVNFINHQFIHNAEYKWLYDAYIFGNTHKCNILQVPYICLCWRTDTAHDSGSQQIVLETSYGNEFIHLGDTLGFGFADGIFERIVVTGKVNDSTVTFHYPLMIDHPAGHMLFEWSFTLPGFTPKEYNLSIIRDYTDNDLVIHIICHEFMHCFKNGNLEEIYSFIDTVNLMFYASSYKDAQGQTKLTGNKLRYQTLGAEAYKQWDDTHDGP